MPATLTLMNAAGHIKGPGPSFEKILRAPVAEITVGSITVAERQGNSGTNFVLLPDGTAVNSMGLNNMGARRARDALPRMVSQAREAGKKLRLSIAPLRIEDFAILTQLAIDCGVDTLELNLGCPNLYESGKRKRIMAYDAGAIQISVVEVLTVINRNSPSLPLAVKLSPYETSGEATPIAELMGELLRNCDSVVLCNTLPDFSPVGEDGKPLLRAIAPDGSVIVAGGMSGTQLKEQSLPVSKVFCDILPVDIIVEGVGGIRSGHDVADYHKAGVSRFQIGTAYFADDNPRIFGDIAREFYELM